MGRVGHKDVAFLQILSMELHLVLYRAKVHKRCIPLVTHKTHKLMDPKWIGINGAFATRSPSGANNAQEKSKRSLMFVLMDVCCKDRPIASATLMKRLAKRVNRMGSGELVFLVEAMLVVLFSVSQTRRYYNAEMDSALELRSPDPFPVCAQRRS